MEQLLEQEEYSKKSCYFCNNSEECKQYIQCKCYPKRKVQLYFSHEKQNEVEMKQEYIKSTLYASNCKNYIEQSILEL